MKFTQDTSLKAEVEALIAWIASRAEDDSHKNNGHIIADFLEKFAVVELKRLENNPETIKVEIEIPDEILVGPMTNMRDAMNKSFDDFMSGEGLKTLPATAANTVAKEETETPSVTTETEEAKTPSVTTQTEGGNGHTASASRKLSDDEKDFIRGQFMNLNGVFEDSKKSCTAMLPNMGDEVSVWQVTGFVSYLHREVASNKFVLPDMDKYLKFLEAHKKLWAQYNSPKYKSMRSAAPQQQVAKASSDPQFRQGTFKRKTA